MKEQSPKPKQVRSEHAEFLSKIGRSLKNIREKKEITIYKMAKDIHEEWEKNKEKEFKVSRNSITMIEEGKIYFTSSTLFVILKYFDIDPETFFKEL